MCKILKQKRAKIVVNGLKKERTMRITIALLVVNMLCWTSFGQEKNVHTKVKNEIFTICNKFPSIWKQNFNKKGLSGSVDIITETDKKLVKLSGNSKGIAHFFCAVRAKAYDGDKIEFTIQAKGNGTGGVGIYQYPKDGSWKWNGAVYKYFKVSEEFKSYTITLTVKGKQPTGKVCLVLLAGKNSEVIVQSIKAKKL